jgi:DNA-binding transcriptional ArsR family regulator
MDVKRFELAAAQASGIVKALAHPARLRIVYALIETEICVTGLAEIAGVSASTVSRHLTLLRKDRIVKARRERQTMVYSLSDARIGKFVSILAETFRVSTQSQKQKRKAR